MRPSPYRVYATMRTLDARPTTSLAAAVRLVA